MFSRRLRSAATWLPAIAVMCLVYYGSSRIDGPGALLVTVRQAADRFGLAPSDSRLAVFLFQKAGHFAEFGLLAWLLLRAIRLTWRTARHPGAGALVLAALFALSDEFHQAFVPGREPRIRDVIIDLAGAAVAIVIQNRLWRLKAGAVSKG